MAYYPYDAYVWDFSLSEQELKKANDGVTHAVSLSEKFTENSVTPWTLYNGYTATIRAQIGIYKTWVYS